MIQKCSNVRPGLFRLGHVRPSHVRRSHVRPGHVRPGHVRLTDPYIFAVASHGFNTVYYDVLILCVYPSSIATSKIK